VSIKFGITVHEPAIRDQPKTERSAIDSRLVFAFSLNVKLAFQSFDLHLAHRWAIARDLLPGSTAGVEYCPVVILRLIDSHGCMGLGEASPSERYGENVDSVLTFLQQVDPRRISPDDLPGSLAYLDSITDGQHAAKCAVDLALHDLAARRAGLPVHDFLGLGFTEGRHLTSFSIGIDNPNQVREKVLAAAQYPVLKFKLGSTHDRENLRALRDAAPDKTIRVDANEAWKTAPEALRQIEWLARDGQIEFVEQPMPAKADPRDRAWLKARSPLPLMADESYRSVFDLSRCVDGFHAVNVKLIKTGGLAAAHEALLAARQAGLKTMLGCMIETSVLITAAAHLAALTDYLDLDGHLLVDNDPYEGVTARSGRVSFAHAPDPIGLRVRARAVPGG
jgi:L-alanine-DL-glutamate epimerase-like enolase superfamily enzyme